MQREGPVRPDPAAGPHAEDLAATEAGEGHPHLPQLSIWPISMAAGITLMGLGFVTTWAMTFAGLFVMFISIVYWAQELRHEHRSEHH